MLFKHPFKGTQYRLWMPNMYLMLVSARSATPTHPAWAIFRCMPRMTKHEIREYLEKIYHLPVARVRTMNYMGKRKRITTASRTVYYKYKNFKKAVVTFDHRLKDVGLGLRVPELEEDDDEVNIDKDNVDDDDEEDEYETKRLEG